jgi:Flp pilus assembly protein TadG
MHQRSRADRVIQRLTGILRNRRSHRGQSLVELALILPFLLAFVGGATDFARAFQASMTLESAVRTAAEQLASSSTDAADAAADAQRIVCLESRNVPGFTPGGGGDPTTCTAPSVTVVSFSVSTASPGTATNPMGSAQVHASIQFDTLFPYPFIPEGGWTLGADVSYSVLRGR